MTCRFSSIPVLHGQGQFFAQIHLIILYVLTGYEYSPNRYFGYQQVIHNHLLNPCKRRDWIIVKKKRRYKEKIK